MEKLIEKYSELYIHYEDRLKDFIKRYGDFADNQSISKYLGKVYGGYQGKLEMIKEILEDLKNV